jgi:hypothetical protein
MVMVHPQPAHWRGSFSEILEGAPALSRTRTATNPAG